MSEPQEQPQAADEVVKPKRTRRAKADVPPVEADAAPVAAEADVALRNRDTPLARGSSGGLLADGPHTLKVYTGTVVGRHGSDVFVELGVRMQGTGGGAGLTPPSALRRSRR